MSKHTSDSMTTAALRDLDPAPATVLTDAERKRAEAAFARIVASPSDDPALVEPGRARPRRWRLLVPVGLAGAAAAVAIPALLTGGGSAYASWTPTPEPLGPSAAAEAAATCRATLEAPDQRTRVLIAERRGDWIYVVFAGAESEGYCLMPNDLIGHPADRDEFPGWDGVYHPDVPEAPALAPHRIEETETTVDYNDEGVVGWAYGHVGKDVTGVTLHTPLGQDVEASVDNGRFAVWFPADGASGEIPGVNSAWTYTVTLADGSTRDASGW